MTNIRTATAIIFTAALLAVSSGCSKENDSVDFSDSAVSNSSKDFSDSAVFNSSIDFEEAPLQTIANEISFGDPVIGGNAILSQDTLDDFTAGLIIGNISKLPDDSEKGNYYCGRFITVELKDNKSGDTVKGILPKNTYTYDSKSTGQMRIDAGCAADSVKLLSIEDNGKKEYILKLEYAREGDIRIAAFAACNMNGTGGLKWYKAVESGNPDQAGYECKVSSEFDYKGGNRFSDSITGLEYEFDTENFRITVK